MKDLNLNIEVTEEKPMIEEFSDDFDFDSEDDIEFDDGFSSGIPENIDTLLINVNVATFDTAFGYTNRYPKNYGTLHDAAIAIADGKIVWIGSNFAALDYIEQQVSDGNKPKVHDIEWKWITPGLIDCHTQIIHAGNRSMDYEAKMADSIDTYVNENIYNSNIISTIMATREASEDELYAQSEKRLQALMSEGVTSIEIKSGYGLDLQTERKILSVARRLGEAHGISIVTSYFAANVLPPEYENNSDDYINNVCEWLTVLHQEGLVDMVDGYIEEGGFSSAQIQKVFDTAQNLGLPVKAHAEKISNIGGSRLVSEYRGLASSHLQNINQYDIEQLATGEVIGVMLPTSFYTMKHEVLPPIQQMRDSGVNLSVSTGYNPDTSPNTSILLAMNMACNLYDMTPAEALAGTTFNAAKALGLIDKGRVAVGMDADLLVWDIERPADLSYFMGLNLLNRRMIAGQWRV